MNQIYLIDPTTRETLPRQRVAFSEIGIRERSDLQEWVLAQPDILGESLLVITSEFAGFDRSSRRLDILALDENGELVVVELKLEAQRTFADLQALRYAAFCSTMTAQQVIDEYSRYHGRPTEEARKDICEFLDVEELAEPSDRPRILLVAGSMDAPELMATVLWLRNFDVDITCLEVTPYRLPGDQILIVPRIVIPLPEAEEYQIRVERKEATRAKKAKEASRFQPLFEAIVREFEDLDTLFDASAKPARRYLQVTTGTGGIHYEWQARASDDVLDVALHFQTNDRGRNLRLMKALRDAAREISEGVEEPFQAEEWGVNWAKAYFELPLQADPTPDYACKAAHLMQVLMDRSWPLVKDHL